MAVGPHLLGRNYVPDTRDWTADKVHSLMGTHLDLSPYDNKWEDLIVLNQGRTNHCVGFGWAGWGDSAPIEDKFKNTDANKIYYEAKVIDGQPNQENGSSVRSGAKAMKNRGKLNAYGFAKTISEIDEWLNNHGPVVMGTDWTNDMFTPDPTGLVHATGSVAGGHCWLLRYKVTPITYRARNSWGTRWGAKGDFFIGVADLEMLLAAKGDACLSLEI
jgi:hypothetical protein